MSQKALISLLWDKNAHVLHFYLENRPRVVLTLAQACTDNLRAMVEGVGSVLQPLEGLIAPERLAEIHIEAKAKLEQFGQLQADAVWRDFCTGHGLDIGAFDAALGTNLLDRLAGAMLLVETLEAARARFQIELLVTNEDLMSAGRTLTEWARVQGVPSLHLAHALALATPYTVHAALHADVLAVFGERGAEGYRDVGVAPERLRITGNPAWDVYAGLKLEKPRVRAAVCTKYRLDPKRPLLVFGTTWAGEMSAASEPGIHDATLRVFLVACAELLGAGHALNIVIKDRPSNAGFGRDSARRLAAEVGLSPEDYVHTPEDTSLLVTAADVLVSVDSNLSVEAMLAGTPAINLMNELGLRMGPSFDAESGILEVAPDELGAVIEAVLDDAELRAGLLELMALKAPHYNAAVDGGACEQVANLMKQMARRFESSRPVTAAKRGGRRSGGFLWECLSNLEDEPLQGLYHDHPRNDLLTLIGHVPKRVLDVGCASGATGKLLKAHFPEVWVAGIELSRAAAEIARERIDLVLTEKLEEVDFAEHGIEPGSIDTLILADVLEHLYDPWGALAILRPLLSEDAQILASIPNSRNLWLMNEVASGRFSYQAEGLLDITHIRFFTKAEIIRMFRETGYAIEEWGNVFDARLAQLEYFPGMSVLETEKLSIKNVTEEELVEMKTAQFLLRARPGEIPLGPVEDKPDLYPVWRVGHALLERDRHWMAERMAAVGEQQPVFHLGVIALAGAADGLVTTLRALGGQVWTQWRLTIVAESPCPDMLAGMEPTVRWFDITNSEEAPLALLNRELAEAAADWVGMIEAGDSLAEQALFVLGDTLSRNPAWQAVYSDEDSIDAEENHDSPYFKPDFSIDLLRAAPYAVGGIWLLRRELFAQLGGFQPEMEGVEHFDLILRTWEQVGDAGIGHVADILYHRALEGGHSIRAAEAMLEARHQALESHLRRCGLGAGIEAGTLPGTYRIRYRHPTRPLVSILIPTKNQVHFLRRCVESLVEKTAWENLEILIIDNGSDDSDARAYLKELGRAPATQLRVLDYPQAFNFSAMCNLGAHESRGDYLLLLNNDTAALEPGWLEEMMGYGQRPDVGVVGARLLFPDQRVQHAGVILGIGESPAEHPFIGAAADAPGYYGRAQLPQNLSAVTAACMLIRKSVYEAVGGMDETRFAVSYNDIDLCLKVRAAGQRVVWTPFASLLHEGGVSQKSNVEKAADQAKAERYKAEQTALYQKWPREIAFDPAYNRNLSAQSRDFQVETAPALTWDPECRPRPRILAHPADRMGCGEYRIISPMRALNLAGRVMGWETSSYLSIPEILRLEPDSIVLQRQVDWSQIEFMQRYINHSKAFRVFELDDLLTNVPIKNARKQAFVEMKDLHKRFRKAASLCHRFVVSTEYLAEEYQGYSDELVVVKNYLEGERWLGHTPRRRGGAKPRVGWAGSVTHHGDLAIIVDVVKATADEVDWVFFGLCLDELRPYVKEFHELVALDQYVSKLAGMDLDLAIAPLEDVPFNHAKSHLRLLEYGIMGYPVICTDITPYRGDYPVTRVPNKFKAWVEAIREHVSDRDELARRGDALRDHVRANWILEDNLDVWLRAWLP